MNTSDLMALVGRTGTVQLHGLTIAVEVVDSKVAYGGTLLLVRPMDPVSTGQTWMEARKVALREGTK